MKIVRQIDRQKHAQIKGYKDSKMVMKMFKQVHGQIDRKIQICQIKGYKDSKQFMKIVRQIHGQIDRNMLR